MRNFQSEISRERVGVCVCVFMNICDPLCVRLCIRMVVVSLKLTACVC